MCVVPPPPPRTRTRRYLVAGRTLGSDHLTCACSAVPATGTVAVAGVDTGSFGFSEGQRAPVRPCGFGTSALEFLP